MGRSRHVQRRHRTERGQASPRCREDGALRVGRPRGRDVSNCRASVRGASPIVKAADDPRTQSPWAIGERSRDAAVRRAGPAGGRHQGRGHADVPGGCGPSEQEFHFFHGREAAEMFGLRARVARRAPAGAVASFAGVGNPHLRSRLPTGRGRCSILGSGAGLDSIIAAGRSGQPARARP